MQVTRSTINAKIGVARAVSDGRITAADGLTVIGEVVPGGPGAGIAGTGDVARKLDEGAGLGPDRARASRGPHHRMADRGQSKSSDCARRRISELSTRD